MPTIFSTEGSPPSTKRRRRVQPHKNAVLLAEIKGEWAKVYVSLNKQAARNKATEIRLGRMVGYRVVGEFEALSPRPTVDGWVVWARCTRVNEAYRKDQTDD